MKQKRTNTESTFEMEEYLKLISTPPPPSKKKRKKDGRYVILGNFVVSSRLEYCGQQICFTDPKTMSQHFFY